MGLGEERAISYRARAAEMRQMADTAQSEELRASFLRLEASWLRLAEAAEKSEDGDPDLPPGQMPDPDQSPWSPRSN